MTTTHTHGGHEHTHDRAAEGFQEPDHFHEPEGEEERAGYRSWQTPKTPYDVFMEEEGLPVHRGIGLRDLRELPLVPWKRTGGRGHFIQLDGTEGRQGMYVIEIPSAGALNAERHVYEEVFWVVEGRGSTEVWLDGGKQQTFEWAAGTLFAIPVNAWHRLVNASSTPALLLSGTTAPPAINLFRNRTFVFDNDFAFTDRYAGEDDYFKPTDDLAPDPVRGRAMRRTQLIPDIVNCDLPLDNQRSPGYRRIEPHMANGNFSMFICQHESGRYAMAHHPPGEGSAVLICLKGKGYTFTWPRVLTINPWKEGHGDLVLRQDYVPGGMVSANPGGTGYYHAHYGIAKEPMRLLVFGGPRHVPPRGRPGQLEISGNLPMEEGGRTITYAKEDPFVREEYRRMIEKEGVEFRMPDWVYETDDAKAVEKVGAGF